MRLISLVILGVACILCSHAQDQNSPVFKTYRLPDPSSLVQQSDVTYQLWYLFILTREANAGDKLAQHELGIRYLTGKGVKADTTKGAYWVEQAAKQNLVPARFNLGILHYNGWGMQWNPFEAYRDFLYCAEQGMLDAQYILGQLLTDNLVVRRDVRKAHRWVKSAADAGYEPAKDALGEFDRLVKAERPQDDKRGEDTSSIPIKLVFLDFQQDTSSLMDDLALLKDALQSGSEELKQALGMSRMLEGELKTGSLDLAAVSRAAEVGSPEALAVIGRCYEKGVGLKEDLILAAAHYIQAIRMGSLKAHELLWNLVRRRALGSELRSRSSEENSQYVWAGLVAIGIDFLLYQPQVGITEAQALRLLQNAADRDHVRSLVELGLCYYSGRWVRQDNEKALALWERAASRGSGEAKVRLAITSLQRMALDSVQEQKEIRVLVDHERKGSLLAQVGLAYCYETGRGVPSNKAMAARLYRNGAQRGSEDAYRALRRMHDEIRPELQEFRISSHD